MIQHSILCQTCKESLVFGSEAPANPGACVAAREMRQGCKTGGCRFEVVVKTVNLDDTDMLRLGLREDRGLREPKKLLGRAPRTKPV